MNEKYDIRNKLLNAVKAFNQIDFGAKICTPFRAPGLNFEFLKDVENIDKALFFYMAENKNGEVPGQECLLIKKTQKPTWLHSNVMKITDFVLGVGLKIKKGVTMLPERLLTIKELTAMGLGSRTKIEKLVKDGKLPMLKIERSTKFRESDVKAFLESCVVQ